MSDPINPELTTRICELAEKLGASKNRAEAIRHACDLLELVRDPSEEETTKDRLRWLVAKLEDGVALAAEELAAQGVGDMQVKIAIIVTDSTGAGKSHGSFAGEKFFADMRILIGPDTRTDEERSADMIMMRFGVQHAPGNVTGDDDEVD